MRRRIYSWQRRRVWVVQKQPNFVVIGRSYQYVHSAVPVHICGVYRMRIIRTGSDELHCEAWTGWNPVVQKQPNFVVIHRSHQYVHCTAPIYICGVY